MATEIVGLEGILKKLNLIEDMEEYKKKMGVACALVERAAKQKAPKDTGELRRSITSKVQTEGTEIEGIIFTPLLYAPYIEYGTGLFAEDKGRTDVPWHYQDDEGNWHTTSGIKPQPYMRPAYNENKEDIKRILKGVLKDD